MSKCKLVILDEVNIKLEGLEISTRRKLVNKFKFELPYARHMPQYKLGRWDGTKSFFGIGGTGYLSNLDEILPIVVEDGYDVEVEDRRLVHDLRFAPVGEDYWASLGKQWPAGHPAAGQPILLRDYQYNVVNKLLENPQGISVVPTGGGKTLTTATLSHKCEPYGRTMVIVPNRSLVVQTEEDYKMLGLDVGVYFGDRKELNRTHTICTWQSLNALDRKDPDSETLTLAEFIDGVNAVIVDECFSGDTLITTPSGLVKIKDIKVGDRVINYCEDTQEFKVDTVVKVHSNLTVSNSELMLRLRFNNESSVDVTANHKFLTTAGWKRADQLLTSDLVCYNGVKTFVAGVRVINRPEVVYNLHVEKDHNYLANGVVVANCHQTKADVLSKILTSNFNNCPIRWGLTGTIPKAAWEQQSLTCSIGPVLYSITAHELQQKDVLAELHIEILQTQEVHAFKSFQDENTFLVTDPDRLAWMAKTIQEIATTGNTLVLVNRISSGESLVALMDDAVFINGSTKLADRKEEFKEINDGDNKILVATFGVAAVGINLPRIFNLVLLEPGKSFVRVIQSIGRGIRKAVDKDFVQIYDIASRCKFSNRHLLERKKFYNEAKYPFSVKKIKSYDD